MTSTILHLLLIKIKIYISINSPIYCGDADDPTVLTIKHEDVDNLLHDKDISPEVCIYMKNVMPEVHMLVVIFFI